MNINDFLSHKDIFIHLTVLIILVFSYMIFARWVNKAQFNIDYKRRLRSNARGFFSIAIVISSLLIWSNEIYSVIISFTAVAAAIAIATKEVLLCIGGGFYKTVSRPFSVGDRIEIDGVRGDVIEFGFLSTQLMEVGPGDLTHQYTGRSVNIPNSKFLTSNIINETFSTDYVLHMFSIPIPRDTDWEKHQIALLESANKECQQYIDLGIKHFHKLARRRQLDPPSIQPRVNIKIVETDQINLIVRVTVPMRIRGTIEQSILKEYLSRVF